MFKDIFKFSAATLVVSATLTGCGAEPQEWVDAFTTVGEQLNLNNTAPFIVLQGSTTIEVPLNGTYQEPGFVALDEEDGDLTDQVLYNPENVDTSTPGTYTIIYRVTDSGNMSASPAVRIVVVNDEEQPIVQPEPPAPEPVPPTPEPEPEPEPSPLVANDNHYTVDAGQVFHATGTQGVGNNDIFDANNTSFSVVTYPQNGELMMSIDGMFTYQPDFGFSGSDSFVYQIANNVGSSTATASITVVKETEASKGFTAFTPSSDSRVIFVSSSVGSDDNDCLSEAKPCKSIGAGLNKMRNGHPDHVYLKRGDTWREEVLTDVKSGRSVSEPAVVAFYGNSGDRPRLENSSNVINAFRGDKHFINFIGLHFSAYKLDPKNAAFTGERGDSSSVRLLGSNKEFLFEDNVFDFTEVVIQDWEGTPRNFVFRRNIWTGKYYNNSSNEWNTRPSNMYAQGVDGLTIEENVIDSGGWHPEVAGAGANMYNHNLYIQQATVGNKFVLRNNVITRASSHGVHGRPGGLFEDNFFARNAISLQMGYNGHPLRAGTKAEAINNVITEGHSMVKGEKACSGSNLCTRAVWGLNIDEPGDGQFKVKGNIVSGLSSDDTQWTTMFTSLATVAFRNIGYAQMNEDNIAYQWELNAQGQDTKYVAPGRTLADYNQTLTGTNSFEDFMDAALSRPLQTWDERYSAKSINQYIRDGFQLK